MRDTTCRAKKKNNTYRKYDCQTYMSVYVRVAVDNKKTDCTVMYIYVES